MIDSPLRATAAAIVGEFGVGFDGPTTKLLSTWADEVTGGHVGRLIELIVQERIVSRQLEQAGD